MDRIGVVGISWREGGPEALAPLTIPADERERRVPELARQIGCRELYYLATCNRIEVGFVSENGTGVSDYRPRIFEALAGRLPLPGESEKTLRAWGGEGAIEHVFLVAAGLDSARIGETEVAGQLRQAFELSSRLGLCRKRLTSVLKEAIRVAAKVRDGTAISRGHVSLAGIALDRAHERLNQTPGPVALIGTSSMTKVCADALSAEGVPFLIVNRTVAAAQQLAEQFGGVWRSLESFQAAPDPVEVVITATGAPHDILQRGHLERLAAAAPSGRPPLVVDLAVPPDVEPANAAAFDVPRIGMDEILAMAEVNRGRRLEEAADARVLVDDALVKMRRQFVDEFLAPHLGALQRRYRQTALEGVERLLRKELSGLGEDERQAVRNWAVTLARRFAHLPSEGLREVAFATGTTGVRAFFQRADAELRKALEQSRTDADGVEPVSCKDGDS